MSYVYNLITQSQRFALKEIARFLQDNDLSMDLGVTEFIEIRLNGKIVACGGVDGNIIKCVAISSSHRGDGISLVLMSQLLSILNAKEVHDLFLFTKPENETLFAASGFYPIVRDSGQVVLMENSPNRLHCYCQELAKSVRQGEKIGSIVMNANPFTLGHLHLIKKASECMDWLHLFLVKADLSLFKFQERFSLVQQGIAGISNISLYPGSDYMISRASFPNYFLKDKAQVQSSHATLDLKLFREYIAPALNINYRFVGAEPLDHTTNLYNQEMCYHLLDEESSAPAIEVIEIPRITYQEQVISASRVRKALIEGELDLLPYLVPQSTLEFLLKERQEILDRYRRLCL